MADLFALAGMDALQANLQKLGAKAVPVLAKALTLEAERVMKASKREVPVDKGILRGSGLVQPWQADGLHGVSVELGYGGAATAYAVIVHENPNATHKPPTKWKYLEDPLKAAESGMAERLGATVAEALKPTAEVPPMGPSAAG